RERVRILLENDITLWAYHLPLDRHPVVGNNAVAGRLLGLRDPVGFGEVGVAGAVDSLSIGELSARVRDVFGREPLVFDSGPSRIRRVGFCSGAAQGSVAAAISAGLDAYITGEVSLPVMHAAREGSIHFLAAGHYATEVPGITALGDNLRERFGMEVEFVDIPNPV
ncbi:MAG TPA: Nif3-like dinuclear metal center hexameric protein, partial [bacterium]|nr:Nif3-like dinuclear metal center hexameric protein [bacterium]